MTRRGAVVAGGLALGAGLLAGLAVRLAAAEALPAERASAAAVAVLGAAVALAPAVGLRKSGIALAPATAFVAAAAAVLVAGGGMSSLGAALVVAGTGALAAAGARVALRCGATRGGASLVGAVVPALLVAGAFLADPWIEWDGSTSASPSRAAWVYRLSPVAAATSPEGGTGVDWQTRRLMYDGHGAGGLSVIGQYYPARAPSAPLWGGVALVLGVAVSLAAGRRDGAPAGSSW